MIPKPTIAVVIPCYKVTRHVLDVIARIGPEVDRIYAVDDACPDRSGDHIESQCRDPRVRILRNPINLGVGGAVMHGYQAAIADDMDVIVKIDGDGQMDPALLPDFVAPILAGEADYTKGNRFFDLDEIRSMPRIRILGNAALSFFTKLSSGYWDLFDCTNGYTAIHRDVARLLPFRKISPRFFFETDILFRLNLLRAVVVDIPMDARYNDEISNLKIGRVIPEFLAKHIRNFAKRIIQNYYFRDMSVASFELPLSAILLLFALFYGGYHWWRAIADGTPTPVGVVMLSYASLLMGLQFLLGFISADIASVPKRTRHRRHVDPRRTIVLK